MSAPDFGPDVVARDSRDLSLADKLTTGPRVGKGDTKTAKEKVEKSPKKKKDKKRAEEKPADDNRNYDVEVAGESSDLNGCQDNRSVLLPPISAIDRRENGSDNKMAAVKSGKGKKAQKENANGNVKEDSEKKKKKKKKKKKGGNGDDESCNAGKEKEMLLNGRKEKCEAEMVEVIKEKPTEDTKIEGEIEVVMKEKPMEDRKSEGDFAEVKKEKLVEDRKFETETGDATKKKHVGDGKSEKESEEFIMNKLIEDGKNDVKTTEVIKKKRLEDGKSDEETKVVVKKKQVEKGNSESAEVSKKKRVEDENSKIKKAEVTNETEAAEVIKETVTSETINETVMSEVTNETLTSETINETVTPEVIHETVAPDVISKTDTTEVTKKLIKNGTSFQQQVIAVSNPGVDLGIEASSAKEGTGLGLKPSEKGKELSAKLDCTENIENGCNTLKVTTSLSNVPISNPTEGLKRDESQNNRRDSEDTLEEKVLDVCADNSDKREVNCAFFISENSECVAGGKNLAAPLDEDTVHAGCESGSNDVTVIDKCDEDIETNDLASVMFTMAKNAENSGSLDPEYQPEPSHDTLTSLQQCVVSARNVLAESVEGTDTPTGCATSEQVNAEEESNIARTVLNSEPCGNQTAVGGCSVDNAGADHGGADLAQGVNEMDIGGADKITVDNFRVVKSSIVDGVDLPEVFVNTSEMTRDQLLQHLQEQQEAMSRLQDHAQEQTSKANQLTVSLRAKLRRRDQEMQLMKSEHEQQLSAVLSHLLFLEGQMQKEHNDVVELLHEKDDVIRRQRSAIEDLLNKNTRYLQALKESHGYSTDNGLVKQPTAQILPKNDNVSIQDHGNKVILRDRNKAQALIHKVRFSAMKDRLRRHKSSLELSQHEPLETLMETTLKYGSEENLKMDRSVGSSSTDRKVRCRSLIENPVTASLFEEEEAQHENPDNIFGDEFSPILSRNDSTSSLGVLSDRASRSNADLSSVSPSYGFNELSKSRSVPHGLPTVVENDISPTNFRGRPLSLPSVDILTKEVAASPRSMTPASSNSNLSKTPVAPTVPAPIPTATPTSSSPPSESNPFKSFKNVFKRKGSSKKKRAAAVTSGQEQSDVLKQHFKKYDMT